MKLLLDTNVLLAAVLVRRPWADDAITVLEAAEARRVSAFAAVHGIATFYYFTAKRRGPSLARDAVQQVIRACDVAPLSRADLRDAAAFVMTDYEDAMHAATARNVGADYVVTRDLKDFAASPVPAISPGDLLRLI